MMELRNGAKECIKPIAGDADFWINIREELHHLADRASWWKWNMWRRTAQRRKRKTCRHFEKFVTEGNEKADELAKEGALLDEGCMAEARAETMQQEREEVYAALQYAASFSRTMEGL